MLSLQFITHQTRKYSYFESACMALKGGCKRIQLRMREAFPKEVETIARQLKSLRKIHGATLILDDHVELARKLEVDEVYLDKKGMPISEARKTLDEAFVIGGTANTFENVKMHFSAGTDYPGVDPFRFITTKKDLSSVLGLEGYTPVLSQMDKYGIRIPVVAIGGIVAEGIPAIMKTGVNGIALSRAILQAPNPVEETRRILNI